MASVELFMTFVVRDAGLVVVGFVYVYNHHVLFIFILELLSKRLRY